MRSKTPTVRPIAWISLVPQLLIMILFMYIWYLINTSNFIILGAITYLSISQLLRRIIAKEHRIGMLHVKKGNFEDAIQNFKNSYEFFKKNNWIDKYRYLTLLSSSKMTYCEMALNNIAFCYGQIGNGQMAKAYYEKTLTEYPKNGMAKAALNLLNSISEE